MPKSDSILSAPSIATVGTFDGVHIGHRAILRRIHEEALSRGFRSLAFVLWPHPLAAVAPEHAPRLLTSSAERIRLIDGTALVDEVIPLEFTPSLMHLTAAEFMTRLRDRYNVRVLVMGYDNSFGSDRLRTVDEYRHAAAPLGIEIVDVAEQHIAGIPATLSSTSVRQAVSAGDMDAAAGILGRPYTIDGSVVPGRQIGRTIGFPTANIAVDPSILLPATGVYAARAYVGRDILRAVVNIGTAPTIDATNKAMTIEAHLPDFSGDLYGQSVRLEFVRRLRAERQFPSLEALRRQLADDVREACLILSDESALGRRAPEE